MKITAPTAGDLAASVFAVPPLARKQDLSLDGDANRALIKHIETGGVSSLLYGGNANLYNMGLYEYAEMLDLVEDAAAVDTWVIPSAGPDFGKLMDQAAILRGRPFPTAMVLPLSFPATSSGMAKGVRRFAHAYGKPVILYLKSESQLTITDIAALVNDHLVCGIKYAIPRANPAIDPFLRQLLDRIGPDLVVSGMAEVPAIVHMRDFGLRSFTSGGVCMAPRLATRLLRAIQDADFSLADRCRAAFLPFEALREKLGVFPTIHDAVTVSGVADMGAQLPMLDNLGPEAIAELQPVIEALMAAERGLGSGV